jgi:hypothetical protein
VTFETRPWTVSVVLVVLVGSGIQDPSNIFSVKKKKKNRIYVKMHVCFNGITMPCLACLFRTPKSMMTSYNYFRCRLPPSSSTWGGGPGDTKLMSMVEAVRPLVLNCFAWTGVYRPK